MYGLAKRSHKTDWYNDETGWGFLIWTIDMYQTGLFIHTRRKKAELNCKYLNFGKMIPNLVLPEAMRPSYLHRILCLQHNHILFMLFQVSIGTIVGFDS